MEDLLVFSALNILRIEFREAPAWDEDLRLLYAAKLAELPPVPRRRPATVLALANLLRPARLRRTVDAAAPRPWHA